MPVSLYVIPFTRVCVAVGVIPPDFEIVTVAVDPDKLTAAVMPFVAVVTEFPFVRATLLPSIFNISFAPSVTLVTVKTSCNIVWPVFTAVIEVDEYRVAALPPSVNVGLFAVAVNAGGTFTATTVTVEAIDNVDVSTPPFAVPPLS